MIWMQLKPCSWVYWLIFFVTFSSVPIHIDTLKNSKTRKKKYMMNSAGNRKCSLRYNASSVITTVQTVCIPCCRWWLTILHHQLR
jgi:hypothetical protein